MNKELSLKVTHLSVNYDKISVLWDLNFSVPRGKLCAIIGPNGAGKSTLIKAILGLVKPLSGKIEILSENASKSFKKISYIPQRETIDWNFPLTVEELVLQGLYTKQGLFKFTTKADKENALKALKVVDMEPFLKRQISQLSTGQKQRVFLARALLQDSDIYFLDEPFSGVDSVTEKFMCQFLQKLKQEGKSIFVIHHNIHSVSQYCEWVVMINNRLVACGDIDSCLTADNLKLTFGENSHLLDEVFALSQNKNKGLNL